MISMETDRHSRLLRILDGLQTPLRFNEPLGDRTWYKVGGPADALAQPQSVEQLAQLLRRCHESNTPVHILGSGANLLVSDEGVDGVVVLLGHEAFTRVAYDGHTAVAGAGADLPKFINACARNGLAGLECMAGIPATVGGAVRMNAGGAFGDIGRSVARVDCMDAQGRIVALDKSQLSFSYRRSSISHPIILQARFDLTPEDPQQVRQRLLHHMQYKKSTQPMAENSAGCAFKNPPKDVSERGAGKLIDDAGLKGTCIGGAEVSIHHANFIIVKPGGTADDILRLMTLVQETVAAKFGVTLEREVVVWRRGGAS